MLQERLFVKHVRKKIALLKTRLMGLINAGDVTLDWPRAKGGTSVTACLVIALSSTAPILYSR